MPETTSEVIWTILGTALLVISAYMVITRVVVPRFGSGWVNSRDRSRAIERAETLLTHKELDEDTRYELLHRLNSLRAGGSQGENWGGRVAERITVSELNEICDRLENSAVSQTTEKPTT